MSKTSDDPLTRALNALPFLQAPHTDPVSRAAWDEVQDGLIQAQAERQVLLAISRSARAFVSILAKYQTAIDKGDPSRIALFADAAGTAEAELRTALAQVPDHLEEIALPSTSSEQIYLASLERFADEGEEEGNEDRGRAH